MRYYRYFYFLYMIEGVKRPPVCHKKIGLGWCKHRNERFYAKIRIVK